MAWDTHHLSQQLCSEEALNVVSSTMAALPWNVDPHEPAALLAAQAQAAMRLVARPRKLWKRKGHISAPTWAVVVEKKMLFKHLKTLWRTLRYTVLQACFVCWRSLRRDTLGPYWRSLLDDLPSWIRLHDHACAYTLDKYHRLAAQVCQAIRLEDAAYYQSLAEQATFTHSHEGLTGLWKHLRALLPKNRNKKNNIQHDLGDSLLAHFEELEAGVTTDQCQLKMLCIQRNNRELARRPTVQHLDLADLPTLTEIEDHCLQQRPHKAPGPDGIPSTLCRLGAVAVAPSLHALICKSFLRGIEPFAHKGGHLCTIYKHKGSQEDAAAYRGILLSDSFAKVTHAWSRKKLLPTMQARRTDWPAWWSSCPADHDGYPDFARTWTSLQGGKAFHMHAFLGLEVSLPSSSS